MKASDIRLPVFVFSLMTVVAVIAGDQAGILAGMLMVFLLTTVLVILDRRRETP